MEEKKKMSKIKIVGIILLVFFILGALTSLLETDKKKTSTQQQASVAPLPVTILPPKPYAFKEFTLGMTLSEFNNKKPNVTYSSKKKYQASRLVNTTICGVNGQAFFLFDDFGKGLQLSYLSITISKEDYPTVRDALIAKYGPPKNKINSIKTTAMGAKFNCETLIWTNGVSEIKSESIGDKISESQIVFYHTALGQSRQDKENSVKAKGDI